jgi:hypothetical protein
MKNLDVKSKNESIAKSSEKKSGVNQVSALNPVQSGNNIATFN